MSPRKTVLFTLFATAVATSCTRPDAREFPEPLLDEVTACSQNDWAGWLECVERLQIEAAAGLVRRDGGEPFGETGRRLCFHREGLDELCVNEAPYIEGNESSIAIQHYLGTFAELPFHYISENHYEGGSIILVHTVSGRLIRVDGTILASPDGSRFAVASVDECATGYAPNRLEIYRVTDNGAELELREDPREWSPREVVWIDDQTLEVTQIPYDRDCSEEVVGRLRLVWSPEGWGAAADAAAIALDRSFPPLLGDGVELGDCVTGRSRRGAECAERVPIAAAQGLVRREGGEPFSGELRRLCFDREGRDELCLDERRWIRGDNETVATQAYLGTMTELPFHVISEVYARGSALVLVHRASGQEIRLHDLPLISPDGTRFVATSMDDCESGETANRLGIWRVDAGTVIAEWDQQPSGFRPAGAEWIDSRTVEVQRLDYDGRGWDCSDTQLSPVRLELESSDAPGWIPTGIAVSADGIGFPPLIGRVATDHCWAGSYGEGAECAERIQIASAGGTVRRVGGEPFSGEQRRICFDRESGGELCVDEPEWIEGRFWGNTIHFYLGTLEAPRLHILSATHGEGYGFIAVHPATGEQVYLNSLPIPSPDGARFAESSIDSGTGYSPNLLTIYRVSPTSITSEFSIEPDDWGPMNVRWLDADDLLVERWAEGGPPYGRQVGQLHLELGSSGWTQRN